MQAEKQFVLFEKLAIGWLVASVNVNVGCKYSEY